MGPAGSHKVQKEVEKSDCLILLGVPLSDTDMAIRLIELKPDYVVHAVSREVKVGYHHYQNVDLKSLMENLLKCKIPFSNVGATRRVAPAHRFAPTRIRGRGTRTVAGVDAMPRRDEPRDRRLVDGTVVTLPIGRRPAAELVARPDVGHEAEPVEILEQRLLVLRPAALPVVILDPEQHRRAPCPRRLPDVERVGDVAEVEVAGGGRRESCSLHGEVGR